MSDFLSNLVHRSTRDKSSPESNASLSLKSKQDRRRAQVRNAQRKHRERRESYINATANSVQSLRDFNRQLMEENALLHATVRANNVAMPELPFKGLLQSTGIPDFVDSHLQAQPFQFRIVQKPAFQHEVIELRSLNGTGSDNIDQQYSSDSGTSGTLSSQTPPPFGYGDSLTGNALSNSLPPAATRPRSGQGEIYQGNDNRQEQLVFAAADFILGLEHACMAHMDEVANRTGSHNHMMSHQVMWSAPSNTSSSATATLTNAAPNFTSSNGGDFGNLPAPTNYQQQQQTSQTYDPLTSNRSSWTTANATLEKLISLSACLSLAHGEITPVQAWFKLVEHTAFHRAYAATAKSGGGTAVASNAMTASSFNENAAVNPGAVDRLLRDLTTALRSEVKCYGFGAVLDEELFDELLFRSVSATAR